jgi:hypothetical protein
MANAVYQKAAASVTWTDTTGDLAMTLNNLAAGTGRQGAEKDWGVLTTARPTLYHFRLVVQQETTGVVGETIELYWKSGDGTDYDNDDGTGDAALSAEDKLKNLKFLGVAQVDEAAADVDISIEGYFRDFNRNGMPVLFNNTADNLQATDNVNKIVVTPIFDEIQ